MLIFVILGSLTAIGTGVTAGYFRWRMHRDRLKTVEYLADNHGLEFVREFLQHDSGPPPATPSIGGTLTKKRSTPPRS